MNPSQQQLADFAAASSFSRHLTFRHRPTFPVGATISKGTSIVTRDGPHTFGADSLVNVVIYTGRPGVEGQFTLFYTPLP